MKQNDDRMELLGRLEDLQNRCIALSNAAAKIAGELLTAQQEVHKMTEPKEV